MARPEGRPKGRVITGRIGDPLREGVGQPDPIILPEFPAVFSRRADRLLSLAEGHPMADWLRFIAGLARAQAQCAAAISDQRTAGDTLPPLEASTFRPDPTMQAPLDSILANATNSVLPDATRRALDWLRCAEPEAITALATDVLRGQVAQQRTGEAVFVVAALQCCFTSSAATLPISELRLLPQRGRCPVCGSAPVAGVITAAGKAPGARYLHCGLCATAWNHVRAVCVNCGEAGALALQEIDGGNGAVKAETCNACNRYAKMLYQSQDMQVEPMADDLASLGLDILVSEAGWLRHVPNPFILTG
jgi:FdhE protein